MAAAGFLALAHTLKRGEHIRVTLLLGGCTAAPGAALELWALAAAGAARRCWSRITACGWSGSRTPSTTSPPATTPRRCGFRSWRWPLGTAVLSIAFVDELVLELRGQRVAAVPATRPLRTNEP